MDKEAASDHLACNLSFDPINIPYRDEDPDKAKRALKLRNRRRRRLCDRFPTGECARVFFFFFFLNTAAHSNISILSKDVKDGI